MSLAQEKALARFAKAVGAGEMLNIHDLKAAYEKATRRFSEKISVQAGFGGIILGARRSRPGR
jgi:hypothetical protein